MHFTAALLTAYLACEVVGLQSPHKRVPKRSHLARPDYKNERPTNCSGSPYLTPATQQYVVNGSAIPGIPFDIGESYAGTIPIDGNSSSENQLYFWFFPSNNPDAVSMPPRFPLISIYQCSQSREITIWLNGGPGCSSLDGLFQENGPFLWQSGTYEPQRNPFSFTNLTNMVWIDQPIGTGFSPAAPGAPAKIMNEIDVATQFAGFWKSFMETFQLNHRKVYITGESYAGQYIPYIAQYFLQQNDTEYYNVKGIQINDPSIGPDAVVIEGIHSALSGAGIALTVLHQLRPSASSTAI